MDEQTYLERAAECERSLYRIARSILWNDSDCADAVQQAVFKGWINRRRLRDPGRFRAWLIAILINECRAIQRRRLKQKRIQAAVEDGFQAFHTDSANADLEEALRALPEQCRLPILLHYMEGYSVREIARILQISESKVTDRMYRGRRKLEEALKL